MYKKYFSLLQSEVTNQEEVPEVVTLSNLDIQDEKDIDKKSLPLSLPSNRNISELLFHPANFEKKEIKMMMRTDQDAVKFAESMSKMDTSKINSTDFHNMMFDIQKIYKKINDKLQVSDLLPCRNRLCIRRFYIE